MSDDDLKQRLNAETGRIHWHELTRHYARGALVTVDAKLDLVDVAARMAANDAASVQQWMEQDRVHRTTTDEARRWSEDDPELWCVVVAPWVLVQEPGATH